MTLAEEIARLWPHPQADCLCSVKGYSLVTLGNGETIEVSERAWLLAEAYRALNCTPPQIQRMRVVKVPSLTGV